MLRTFSSKLARESSDVARLIAPLKSPSSNMDEINLESKPKDLCYNGLSYSLGHESELGKIRPNEGVDK